MADDPRARLAEVLHHFRDAMFVTRRPDGRLRARPMAIADRDFDGDVWLATSESSGKIDEIRSDDHVCIAMQGDRRYLSLSGRARLVRDPAKARELWSPAWEAWFPDGPDDADLVLIHVDAVHGAYWDNHGAQGVKNLFDMVKAVAKDKSAEDERGDDPKRHGQVDL